MRALQHTPTIAGTVAALFFGAVAWGGLQYIQSLLRRAGVIAFPSLSNVNTIVNIVQWMLIVLVVGFVVVLWRHCLARHRWNFSQTRQHMSDIRHFNLYEVSNLVGDVFRYDGWMVHDNSGEDGPDLVLQKTNGNKTLVWCKFWRLPISEDMLKEVLFWSKTYRAPSKIVTLRAPSPETRALAQEHNIELIGREQMLEWKQSLAAR